jgi:hypothetical protein
VLGQPISPLRKPRPTLLPFQSSVQIAAAGFYILQQLGSAGLKKGEIAWPTNLTPRKPSPTLLPFHSSVQKTAAGFNMVRVLFDESTTTYA